MVFNLLFPFIIMDTNRSNISLTEQLSQLQVGSTLNTPHSPGSIRSGVSSPRCVSPRLPTASLHGSELGSTSVDSYGISNNLGLGINAQKNLTFNSDRNFSANSLPLSGHNPEMLTPSPLAVNKQINIQDQQSDSRQTNSSQLPSLFANAQLNSTSQDGNDQSKSTSSTFQSLFSSSKLSSTLNNYQQVNMQENQSYSLPYMDQYSQNQQYLQGSNQYNNYGYNPMNMQLNGYGQQYGDYYNQDESYPSSLGYEDGSQENLLEAAYSGVTNSFHYYKEMVEDLGPEEVRWFYKITDVDKKWIPFIGYDSLRIEWKYRDLLQQSMLRGEWNQEEIRSCGSSPQDSTSKKEESKTEDKIIVRGGLYEVDVNTRKGNSIYWKGTVF